MSELIKYINHCQYAKKSYTFVAIQFKQLVNDKFTQILKNLGHNLRILSFHVGPFPKWYTH